MTCSPAAQVNSELSSRLDGPTMPALQGTGFAFAEGAQEK